MALPNTYILSAPDKADNLFGGTILSSDLIRGLRRINNNISVPAPEHYQEWYPGKRQGMSTMWLGQPPVKYDYLRVDLRPKLRLGKKITAFHLGAIPEFTQIGPDGHIIIKGWRAIFRKVINARAATKRKIEKQFRIKLEYDGTDSICKKCFMDGKRTPVTSKGGVCDLHHTIRKISMVGKEKKKEKKWDAEHPKIDVGKLYFH